MRFGRIVIVIFLCIPGVALAQAQPKPYETIRRSTGSYIGERDPLGLGLRLHIAMRSPYALWCASPELFFTWAKTSAGDFLSDADAIMMCHGNPVPGAISSYVPAGPLGKLSVGLVHFDDAASMPFQLELLQGVITLRLLAQQNGLTLSDEQLDQLLTTLTETYRAAAASDRDAVSLLNSDDDPWIARLLSSHSPYTELLDRYTSIGQFRRSIDDRDGQPRELLDRPSGETADAIAAALADGVRDSASLAQQTRYRTRDDFRDAIRDVARRTQLGQPFNPGTKQRLVLLRQPLRDWDHDVILCFRQQIPSAAERTGLARRDNAPPAQRAVRAAQSAMAPQPFMLAAATIGGSSYTIELLDPWSTTLAEQEIKSFDALLHLTKIWAIATGSTHHQGSKDQAIARRLTPELRSKLKALSDAYLKQHAITFDQLQSDPAARTDASAAKDALSNPSP